MKLQNVQSENMFKDHIAGHARELVNNQTYSMENGVEDKHDKHWWELKKGKESQRANTQVPPWKGYCRGSEAEDPLLPLRLLWRLCWGENSAGHFDVDKNILRYLLDVVVDAWLLRLRLHYNTILSTVPLNGLCIFRRFVFVVVVAVIVATFQDVDVVVFVVVFVFCCCYFSL